MNFSENLKNLRKQNNISQSKLASVIGVTDRTCRKYESSEIEPTLSVLMAIADFFDVSLDYLVGRSDDPTRR